MEKKKFGLFRILIIALLLIGGATAVYEYKTSDHPFAFPKSHLGQDAIIKNWIVYLPKEGDFTIKFPKRPDFTSRELPIPKSEETLPYHEYTSEDGLIKASVSYTVLPDNWLKWGSGMVLKGALKVIMDDTKNAHLIGSGSNSVKSFPALDFERRQGDLQTAGTLVLVGNTLYKIEITYPEKELHQVKDKIAPFINSFQPKKA